MNRRLHQVLAFLPLGLFLALGSNACEPRAGGEASSEVSSAEVLNLRAFAKLYGYLRYFHPSDEGGEIDWEKLAVFGAEEVRGSESPSDLATRLEGVFLPIAPTLQILQSGETARSMVIDPSDKQAQTVTVAWQHRGVGLVAGGIYESARTNRVRELMAPNHGFGGVGGRRAETDQKSPG